LKLLYITNGICGSGGLERVLSIKTSYLADTYNYNVHIIKLNEDLLFPFYYFSDKIVLHNLKKREKLLPGFFDYWGGLLKLIAEIEPNVISVCDDGIKGFLIPLLKRGSIPIIYERHASIELNFSIKKTIISRELIHFILKKLAINFDVFVLLTNGNLKEWSSNNLLVIPNPISFYPKESSTLLNKRVIAVGSHSYNKVYDLLLRAWSETVKRFTDLELVIFGKSDLEGSFIKLSQELNISESVKFFNPISNIETEYLKSSIMVLPSRSEGFGMVLIEAMACGLPCVAFDCPHGPGDIITHGEDGILVENGDINVLAASIEKLMLDSDLRKKMGSNAKINAQRYLPERIMPVWDKLFKELVL